MSRHKKFKDHKPKISIKKKLKMAALKILSLCSVFMLVKSDVEMSTTKAPFISRGLTTTSTPRFPINRPIVGNFQQPHRQDTSITNQDVLLHLQRIHDRLTAMEARENQRTRKLDSVDYRLTRLEVLIQERSSTLDKIESLFSRRMETLEFESNKVLTLLEVTRDELEKIHKLQIELKVDMSKMNPVITSDGSIDPSTPIGDQPAKLQIMQTTLNNLRRMSDITHQKLAYMQVNVTDSNNKTRLLIRNQAKCLTKEYFYSFMRELSEKETHHVILQSTSVKTDDQIHPKDCADVMENGNVKSGIYQIQPKGSNKPFFVFCDMKTEGGGWTVIQRRTDGSINFYRQWQDYKNGFGNLMNEHWLGNEKLHLLTNQAITSLRIELEDFEDHTAYSSYNSFGIGPESEGYMIKILGGYEGEAGDSLNYHSAMKFSTEDMDNDQWEGGNCAELHTGGWWYNGCDMSNLNGQYLGGEVPESFENKGMYWYEWHGPSYSLRQSEMKIRPREFKITSYSKNESDIL